jgi:alcohol oxidase
VSWPTIAISATIDFPSSSPADLVILRWAYKHARDREIAYGHPTFAEGSRAAIQVAGTPTEISAPRIVYTKEDDAIDEFHMRTGSSTLKTKI